MNATSKVAGLALAAAGLFAAGCDHMAPRSMAMEAKVHCAGVNSCKGQSDCKTATNGCKGQNSCKGQGFNDMPKAACESAGGKII